MIKLVDADNNEIGSRERGFVRKNKLWHRVSFIFIITKQRELLVQVRSQRKDYCPGYFDLASAGGVVDSGEEDDIGAKRELEEELGLTDIELSPSQTFKYEPADGSDNFFQNVYFVKDFDADNIPLTFKDSEVERIERWPVTEIAAKLSDPTFKVTPDSKFAWEQVQNQV